MSLTILLSSAGRRTELLQCFRNDARDLGLDLRVLAVDLQPEYSAACQVSDARFAVPECGSPDFIPRMLELCQRERVSLLVPTIDPELEVFAENASLFSAIGTRVVVSDSATVRLARNKMLTAEFLKRIGVPSPQTRLVADAQNLRYPAILKPIGGSSSIGVEIIKDAEQLRNGPQGEYVVQELWKGREFTVNFFIDETGALRSIVPHWRKETRAGEVSKGITWREPLLIALCRQIAAALPGARGPLCFQAIMTPEGEAAVFEINARFGGGYPLAHAAGAKFSKWLLEEAAGLPSTAHDMWTDRLMMLRYDAATFLQAPQDS